MACPCGKGESLEVCCGPILSGKRQAETAEELMRARYTAYATGNISEYYAGTADTMNMRIRAFAPNGTVTSFLDTSCGPVTNGCATGKLSRYLSPGSYATVQCNGVRKRTDAAGWARDRCHIELFENFV